jgi:hypothetical protein
VGRDEGVPQRSNVSARRALPIRRPDFGAQGGRSPKATAGRRPPINSKRPAPAPSPPKAVLERETGVVVPGTKRHVEFAYRFVKPDPLASGLRHRARPRRGERGRSPRRPRGHTAAEHDGECAAAGTGGGAVAAGDLSQYSLLLRAGR